MMFLKIWHSRESRSCIHTPKCVFFLKKNLQKRERAVSDNICGYFSVSCCLGLFIWGGFFSVFFQSHRQILVLVLKTLAVIHRNFLTHVVFTDYTKRVLSHMHAYTHVADTSSPCSPLLCCPGMPADWAVTFRCEQ